jgi:hypothetical protein
MGCQPPRQGWTFSNCQRHQERGRAGRVTAASTKEGAILGTISGFGNGQDGFVNRLANSGVGLALGAGIGAIAPAAIGFVAMGFTPQQIDQFFTAAASL